MADLTFGRIPGVEVHANVLENVFDGRVLRRAGQALRHGHQPSTPASVRPTPSLAVPLLST